MRPYLDFSGKMRLMCKQHEVDDQVSARLLELKRCRPDIHDIGVKQCSAADLHVNVGAGFEVDIQGTIFFKEGARPASAEVEQDGQTALGYSFKVQPMFTVFAAKGGATLSVRCSKCRSMIDEVADYLALSEGQRESAVEESVNKHLQTAHGDIDPASVVF